MKQIIFFLLIVVLFSTNIFSQDYRESIVKFQTELKEKFKDPDKSPLLKEDREQFKGLNFFPVDEKYSVKAKFKRVENAIPFKMKTTTSRLPTYEVFGIATFIIDNQEYELNVYQSHELRLTEEYKSHLFLPFTDLTSGKETYGGGRFLDLEIPEGDVIVIDFNKAYNPYCAYNYNYSCPIPPKENNLNVQIRAGVRL